MTHRLAGVWAALLLASAAQADPLTQQAEALANLRADVEALNSELERKQAEARAEQRALASQKAELQAQLRREELRLAQIRSKLSEKRQALLAQGTDEQLKAAVLRAAAELKAAVGAGLPFRVPERQAAVGKLVASIEDGTLRPERAVSRLWALVEDELRLAREVALQRQSIELDGQEVLVEVAHVGLVMLYFKTESGDYGLAEQAGSGWTWSRLAGAERALAASLFDDLRKGVREGWFLLAGQLPRGEG